MPAIAGTTFRLEIGSNIAGVPALKTKNVVVMARALACDDETSVQMTGTAEGVVNGQRQSLKLELMPMATPGVFAVRKQWSDGTWIVNLTATCPGRKATAGALVALDQNSALLRNKTKLLERAATEREVTSLLKDLAST
jgi:nitrogen fixation protein FixH